MDYETFDRLHKQDPLRFSLAMEIFLDKGRIATLESGRDNLTDFVLHKLAHLLREASLRDSEREAYNRQYQALANLYTLERLYRQENLENCRKVIDRMEEEDLAVCLSDNLPPSERELGLTVSPRERYLQLKEAVEAREAEAQETDGAAS